MISKGNIWNVVFLVTFFAIIWYATKYSKIVPKVRRPPAIDGIEEAIRRSVEMGKPVVCEMGQGGRLTTTPEDMQTIAGLNILSYVAEICGKFGIGVTTFVAYNAPVVVAAEDMQKIGFLRANSQKEPGVRVIPTSGHEYVTRVGTELVRMNVGAYIAVGNHMTSQVNAMELASRAGSIIIQGTHNAAAVAYLLPGSDYCFNGEEMYAASAIASQNAAQIRSILGQDWCRMVAMGLFLFVTIAYLMGFSQIGTLIRM